MNRIAPQVALPEDFCRQMVSILGKDEAEELFEILDHSVPSVSVRLNPMKESPNNIPTCSPELQVPWCANGYYLSERLLFTEMPGLHGGAFYVQEASSMALAALQPILGNQPLAALDMCAAPGGKSTLLHDILPQGSLLVSNEIVPTRAQILCENILKWGRTEHIVTQSAPTQWTSFPPLFDLILVDAPCSGEGMFRKDKRARSEWSPSNVALCAERQREIVDSVWGLLRPEGFLVYSTCTFNTQENDEQVDYLVRKYRARPIAVPSNSLTLSDWGEYPCYRFMPHRSRGEGLFMAVVRKSEEDVSARKGKRKANALCSARPTAEVARWIRPDSDCRWYMSEHGKLWAGSQSLTDMVGLLLSQGIHILSAGIEVAEVKGNKWMPTHALALSENLQRGAFCEYEVHREEALRYLSREVVTPPADMPRGHTLITHGGLPLGFVNHLGSRANNLYPAHWRIRHLSENLE